MPGKHVSEYVLGTIDTARPASILSLHAKTGWERAAMGQGT